jgi:hypothetical protein
VLRPSCGRLRISICPDSRQTSQTNQGTIGPVQSISQPRKPCMTSLVLPRSGPEPRFEPDFWSGSPWFGPRFEPDFWSGSPWFGPRFSHQPKPDRKAVLGSTYPQTVLFWFGLPEPFRTVVNFDFDFDRLRLRQHWPQRQTVVFGICALG